MSALEDTPQVLEADDGKTLDETIADRYAENGLKPLVLSKKATAHADD